MRKKWREICLYTCSPRPLIHSSPSTLSSTTPYTRIDPEIQKPLPPPPDILTEKFIVRCEKNDIYRADDIVKYVRTLWLSLIQFTNSSYEVSSRRLVYNRRISSLHEPSSVATRYTSFTSRFLIFFFFFFNHFHERISDVRRRGKRRKRAKAKCVERSCPTSPKIIRGCQGYLFFFVHSYIFRVIGSNSLADKAQSTIKLSSVLWHTLSN